MPHALITGGTGFIGSAICQRLIETGYSITILSRRSISSTNDISYIKSLDEIPDSTVIDVCINLAGEVLFNGPWTPAKRRKIRESRFGITSALVSLNQRLAKPITTLLSGSAVGYYGDQSDTNLTEDAVEGSHDGAKLCLQWEQIAKKCEIQGTRVCLLRTGIVLGNGGALKLIRMIFQLGLGSPLGSGKQYWPWVSLEDMTAVLQFLITNTQLCGPINICSPNQITNKEFSKTLASVLHRPFWLPSPPNFFLKWISLGGFELLTDSVRLESKKLTEAGFVFRHQQVEEAIRLGLK